MHSLATFPKCWKENKQKKQKKTRPKVCIWENTNKIQRFWPFSIRLTLTVLRKPHGRFLCVICYISGIWYGILFSHLVYSFLSTRQIIFNVLVYVNVGEVYKVSYLHDLYFTLSLFLIACKNSNSCRMEIVISIYNFCSINMCMYMQ